MSSKKKGKGTGFTGCLSSFPFSIVCQSLIESTNQSQIINLSNKALFGDFQMVLLFCKKDFLLS